MSVTPNAIGDTKLASEDRDRLYRLEAQVANALAVTPGLDIEKAMIAFELHQAGWKVHWPLFAGGHLWFSKDGTRLSYAALKELLRFDALLERECEQCGDSILSHPAGKQRGRRVDRRYCSSACRQRAYRKRKTNGGHES